MVTCSVSGCRNTAQTRHGEKAKYSFFKFPKDKAVSQEWVRLCNNWRHINTQYARVCSAHFAEEDYSLKCRMIPDCRIQLRPDAVPSLNLPLTIDNNDTDSAFEHNYCSGESNDLLKEQYEELQILVDDSDAEEVINASSMNAESDEDVEVCEIENAKYFSTTDYSSDNANNADFQEFIDYEDEDSIWDHKRETEYTENESIDQTETIDDEPIVYATNDEHCGFDPIDENVLTGPIDASINKFKLETGASTNDDEPCGFEAIDEPVLMESGETSTYKIKHEKDVEVNTEEQDNLFGKTLMSIVRSLPAVKRNAIKMQMMQLALNAQNEELGV